MGAQACVAGASGGQHEVIGDDGAIASNKDGPVSPAQGAFRYLPMKLNNVDVLIHEGGNMYRADNSKLKSDAPVLGYRMTANVGDKDGTKGLPWGERVQGSSDGNGWIRIVVSDVRIDPPLPGFLSVQVPPNGKPGDTMEVQDPTSGIKYHVSIPPGYAPGSVFQMQIASQHEMSDQELERAVGTAACTVAKGALNVGKALASATWQGAKFAHSKGWDKKAAIGTLKVAGAGLTAMGILAGAAANAAASSDNATKPQGSTFWCVVPPNATPGSQILVMSPQGQQVIVTLPLDARPGSQFQVQV